MSSVPLDDRYFIWLYSQVGSIKQRARARTHWSLLRQLYETIFVAIVSHDENRIADTKDLRCEYMSTVEDAQGNPVWMRSPCSMLEILIVLSRQLAFETDDDSVVWFWHLVEVLDLERFNDLEYDDAAQETIAHVLDRVVWRQYEPDGYGGLFPLRNASRDQRDIELWYQLNAYLLEQF